MPAPVFVKLPMPSTAPENVASWPLVSTVPPAGPSDIGPENARSSPLMRSVPPVKVARLPVHPSAPALLATKVRPLASIALPFPQSAAICGAEPADSTSSADSAPVAPSTANARI